MFILEISNFASQRFPDILQITSRARLARIVIPVFRGYPDTKTNILHLKIGRDLKGHFIFQPAIFRIFCCIVSGRVLLEQYISIDSVHITFVFDAQRRYCSNRKQEESIEGHVQSTGICLKDVSSTEKVIQGNSKVLWLLARLCLSKPPKQAGWF